MGFDYFKSLKNLMGFWQEFWQRTMGKKVGQLFEYFACFLRMAVICQNWFSDVLGT
jgi:hypothetical protein